MIDRRAWLKLTALGAGSGLATAGGAAAIAQPASEGPPRPTVTILARGEGKTDYGPVLQRLGDYIAVHLREYGLPGITFCMADRSGFTAVIVAGWADVDKRIPVRPDHLFQIGSISKSFGAICVLRAAKAAQLSLDDAVADHLPGVPLPRERITIRQLLAHTTGLPDDAPTFPRGGDERLWLGFAPGSRFSYSNTAYDLLAPMLEAIHKKPYAEILRTEVLEPLGMAASKGSIRSRDMALYATGYWPADLMKPAVQAGPLRVSTFLDTVRSAGCVAATAPDMARYVRYLIDAGSGHGAPLLSDADSRALTGPVIEAPVFGPNAHYTLGLGLVPIAGRELLHHTGGMLDFSSSIHVDASAGVGAFASTNARSKEYRPRDVTAYACTLMRAAATGAPPPPPPEIRHDDRIPDAADYEGRYEAANGEAFTLRAENGRLLFAAAEGGAPAALRSHDDDAFIAPVAPFDAIPLVFSRSGAKPDGAWRGDVRFARGQSRPAPSLKVPETVARLAGLYVSDDPWAGSFRVVAREGGLWLNGADPLILLPDGSYRIGKEPWNCERLRFDAAIADRPQRAVRSGIDHLRLVEAGDFTRA